MNEKIEQACQNQRMISHFDQKRENDIPYNELQKGTNLQSIIP